MLHTNRGRVHRRRTPADARGLRRVCGRRVVAPLAAAALLLRTAGAGAAAYLPGAEPDPPTGAQAVAASDTSPVGNGIRWEIAPVRTAGSVSLDGRWLDRKSVV